jgi:hypothetical protein
MKAGDDKVIWIDYVGLPSYVVFERRLTLAQKNITKVTAPGKMIYVDDGWLYIDHKSTTLTDTRRYPVATRY